MARPTEKKLAIGVHRGLPEQACRHPNVLPIGLDPVTIALLEVRTVLWQVLSRRHSEWAPCGLPPSVPVCIVTTTADDRLRTMNSVIMVAKSR